MKVKSSVEKRLIHIEMDHDEFIRLNGELEDIDHGKFPTTCDLLTGIIQNWKHARK